MKTPQDMTGTLEELTSMYLVEIRRRQPTGPYYLGGWPAGGICAYKAAQQLAREGCKAEKLILIDSFNPIGLENPPQHLTSIFLDQKSDPTIPVVRLLNGRTDSGGDGWASLVGRENLQITVMDKVDHLSMMDKGPHKKQFASFLQRALA
ncbi:hypothetical protein TSTA_009760 [Talaromyces stipitatus ATCC 10500]|uniref:Thioesterase domain-containing protein n=1 Tax=Talaromyces stipitatus (strain ATCC 10500 / CBS 375.48 / QM 6759 / NRRL 1006) TaxID=441959 RepID=B8MFY9_TALSN|nr:uncharacterized protein TSTA_009760 [Talaromyces stipitatus ATCC 10500]EED15856.1 hypothetical protein TSTA_009760 [Talaromyces stipitatus ATCC 10500]